MADDPDGAQAVIDALADAGVDFDDVTDTLEREGVASFADSYRDALATLERRTKELTSAQRGGVVSPKHHLLLRASRERLAHAVGQPRDDVAGELGVRADEVAGLGPRRGERVFDRVGNPARRNPVPRPSSTKPRAWSIIQPYSAWAASSNERARGRRRSRRPCPRSACGPPGSTSGTAPATRRANSMPPGFGERFERVLRRAVRRDTGRRDAAADGSDVHDATAAGLEQRHRRG